MKTENEIRKKIEELHLKQRSKENPSFYISAQMRVLRWVLGEDKKVGRPKLTTKPEIENKHQPEEQEKSGYGFDVLKRLRGE